MVHSPIDREFAAVRPEPPRERGITDQADHMRSAAPTAASEADRATPAPATRFPRIDAAITALAPAVVAAGLLYHPHIGSPSDPDFLAMLEAAVVTDPERWALAHLTIAIGSGLLILAFLAIRSHLRSAGDRSWSLLALPFVIMGSVLFALLPAMEFAPLVAAEAGVDVQAVQAALLPRLTSVLQASALLFAVGVLGFAVGVARSSLLGPALTWLVVAAMVVMAAARFAPLLAAHLYLGPASGPIALWPLAYAMWKSVATPRVRGP